MAQQAAVDGLVQICTKASSKMKLGYHELRWSVTEVIPGGCFYNLVQGDRQSGFCDAMENSITVSLTAC